MHREEVAEGIRGESDREIEADGEGGAADPNGNREFVAGAAPQHRHSHRDLRIRACIASFDGSDAQHMYIVMELLRGGELYSNICGRAILSELEAYQIIAPLTNCLCYLHNMGIIHRDIKPENILCDSSLFDVKIADFGFSKLIFPREKLDYPCGTLNYIGLG